MESVKNYDLANVEVALKKLLKILKQKGFNWYDVKPINQSRYYIVKGYTENLLVLFKREVFFNFGKMFKDQGYSGVGDGINVKDLQEAIRSYNIKTIYCLFPDEKIYYIDLQDFLIKSIKSVNKEGKEVRYISIHEYKRLE